jgi:hypothetical protein
MMPPALAVSTARPPTVSPERAALAAAVKAVKQTESDLLKLQAAADRARDKRLTLSSALADRETILIALRDNETARARQAFVNNRDDTSPLPAAEQTVTKVKTELSKIEALEDSIYAETEAVERRLSHQRHQLDEAIGTLLAASPELAALNREIRECWARLRSLRGAAAAVSHAIPFAAPHRVLDDWQAVENINPVDHRDPVDHEYIQQWAAAVAALHDDASAPLPEG